MIPTKFNLFAKTYKIKFREDLTFDTETKGRMCQQLGEIELQVSTKANPSSEEDIELTYFHEIVHLMLSNSEDGFQPKLSHNEEFVDRMANCLHQILKTSEYEKRQSKC